MQLLNTEGKVLFEAEAYDQETLLNLAKEANIDLRGVDLYDGLLYEGLTDLNLEGANLEKGCLLANVVNVSFKNANLSWLSLRSVGLINVDFTGACVNGVSFWGCKFVNASLRVANLEPIKSDLFLVLSQQPQEVRGLREAIISGAVDGSTYNAECACLVGTIANVKFGFERDDVEELDLACRVDANSLAERWCLGIEQGDTPETSEISAITLEWIDEFIAKEKAVMPKDDELFAKPWYAYPNRGVAGDRVHSYQIRDANHNIIL